MFSLPAPSFPPVSRFGEVAGSAFSVAIVSFAVNISLAKLFAKKRAYSLDSDQVHFDIFYCVSVSICSRVFTCSIVTVFNCASARECVIIHCVS